MKKQYCFKLYVLGHRQDPHQLVRNLRVILDSRLKGRYTLKVIDALQHPRLAERDRILAAPALLKTTPPPAKKVVGDLSHKDKLLDALSLTYETNSATAQRQVSQAVSLQLASDES